MNLLSLPFYLFTILYLTYLFFKRKENFFEIFSALLFSYFLSENLKFIFKVPRQHFFSPYSYPSSHSSVSTTFLLFLKGKILLIFLPIYLLNLYGRIWIHAHDFFDILGGVLTGILSYLLYKILRRYIGKEFDRKAFHVGLGTFLFLLTLKDYYLSVKILLFLSILGFPLTYKPIFRLRDFVDYYGSGKFKGMPALTFILGVLFASIFGKKSMLFGIQNLIWVDFGAFLFGKFFKTRKKSIYGLIGSSIFLLFPLIILGEKFHIFYLTIPILELVSLYDNVTVPFFSAFLNFLVGCP